MFSISFDNHDLYLDFNKYFMVTYGEIYTSPN